LLKKKLRLVVTKIRVFERTYNFLPTVFEIKGLYPRNAGKLHSLEFRTLTVITSAHSSDRRWFTVSNRAFRRCSGSPVDGQANMVIHPANRDRFSCLLEVRYTLQAHSTEWIVRCEALQRTEAISGDEMTALGLTVEE
jgi:hypothetical protein